MTRFKPSSIPGMARNWILLFCRLMFSPIWYGSVNISFFNFEKDSKVAPILIDMIILPSAYVDTKLSIKITHIPHRIARPFESVTFHTPLPFSMLSTNDPHQGSFNECKLLPACNGRKTKPKKKHEQLTRKLVNFLFQPPESAGADQRLVSGTFAFSYVQAFVFPCQTTCCIHDLLLAFFAHFLHWGLNDRSWCKFSPWLYMTVKKNE